MKLFNRGRFEPNTGAPRARMSLSAVLIYFVVVLFLFTGITYASYSSTASGTATATVAKWNITATKGTEILTMDAGESATYKFSVKSTSEVAAEYKIQVSNIPTGVTVKLDSKAGTVNGTTVTFTGGTFAATGGTNNHTLTFLDSGNAAATTYKNIQVKVLAEQAG